MDKVNKFMMPSDFKTSTIEFFNQFNQSHPLMKISETYGQISINNLFSSARNIKETIAVNKKDFERYIRVSLQNHIAFNHTFNAACLGNKEFEKQSYHQMIDFFKYLESIGVDSVTVTNPAVIEMIKTNCNALKVKASVVLAINTPTKAKYMEKLGVDRMVLYEGINRSFQVIENIRKNVNCELELIVNTLCLKDCPFSGQHYNSLAHSKEYENFQDYYSRLCMFQKMDPVEFIKINWIRPEDIPLYNQVGINNFKVRGRTLVTLQPDYEQFLNAYAEQSYNGDLILLINLFTGKNLKYVVNNKSLNGFVKQFFEKRDFCTGLCASCGYCNTYAEMAVDDKNKKRTQMHKRICEGILQRDKLFSINDWVETCNLHKQ